jgi:UDP-2-acetamido-3-amino-2,3-dideoxy-glucuronate N-acetyltransferase
MTMKNKIRVAVIGCGYWGKNLVRNFAELGHLAAVCDSNSDQAQQMAEQYDVKSLTVAEALSSTEISGVVIAAPAVQHYDLTLAALNAGKHVFVEKPLALHVQEAQELCKLADKQQRILMVGHLLQYHPAFLELKQLIKSGKLGKLLYIYSNRLNLGKFRNEENILWSFAPHDISMILSLVNDLPTSVYATGACHLNPHIADVTTTHLSFKNGIRAHIFVSWLHPFKEQKLVVVGDRGMAVFDDGLSWGEKLYLYPHEVNWINGMPTPTKADPIHIPIEVSEPLKLECKHFLDCIAQEQKPRTDAYEGLNVLHVLNAAEQSMKTGQHITIEKETPLFYKHETSYIDTNCEIGEGTKIWHFSHILKGTKIGHNCVIGQNVMIGPDVIIGNNCKIQNNVSLYNGITLEDGVFCGPSCVFTNVYNPRAEIERKAEFRKTHVEKGVSIGANATIVCGTKLGAYSFIGAGAVVIKDVKPHAVMVGNPARQIGWMSHAGEKLTADLICPREGRKYRINSDQKLEEIKDDSSKLKAA